ncbi:MAG: hypothetical protein IPK82_10475 [Polyangiaceae bacterium]|nr:hypothetical protein [Polyangiaceae bacterium]
MGPLIIVGLLAVGLAIGAIVLALQNSKLKTQLDDAQTAARDNRQQSDALRSQLAAVENERRRFQLALEEEQRTAQMQLARLQESAKSALDNERQEKEEFLDHQEQELKWYREELEKRPKITRKTYKILTLGVSGTGKTALTLKWANPLMDLGTLQGTKIERYERTVSHVTGKDVLIEHVFEVGDWGGEHIVDAQQELIVDEIHGLLMVVDLAGREAKAVDPARIQMQLREFQPESLKFFFGPKTIASCKTVVLFINKSDVLSGTPVEVEREARRCYQRLIDDLERFKSQLDVRVLVGSATYGHSTHHLFAHFVERILPRNAYDNQLLQRMKGDTPEATTQQIRGPGKPPGLPPIPAAPLPAAPPIAPPPPPLGRMPHGRV